MFRPSYLLALLIYFALAAAVFTGLASARQWALRELGQASAQQDWQTWTDEVRATQDDPTRTVKRRVPGATEPPLLILLRDNFLAVNVAVLLVLSVLYGFGLLVAFSRRSSPSGASGPQPPD